MKICPKDVGLPAAVCELLESQIHTGDFNLVLSDFGKSGGATVIHDDDFPIVKECALQIAALLLGPSFAGWAPMAITSLVWLLFDFRKKGVRLSAMQSVLVIQLKGAKSLSAEELANGLGVKKTEVQPELKSLQRVSNKSGRIIVIVRCDDANRWSLADGI